MTQKPIACALLAALCSVVTACSDDAPINSVEKATSSASLSPTTTENPASGEAPTTVEPASSPNLEGLPDDLLALDDVDIAQSLQRGCLGWSFAEYRDSGAINDAVSSFLYNAPPQLQLDRIVADQDTFNELIRNACEQSQDPSRAWAVLSDGLGITNDDFSSLVDASCDSYKASQPLKAEEAGFDLYIREIVGLQDLDNVIDQLCR